jgi:hypothetical protein
VSGWLTYRNINSLSAVHQRGSFQRSLTAMTILQIIAVVIPTTPYVVVNVYQAVTSSITKSSHQLALENLISSITNTMVFTNCATNFYVYLIASSPYRREFLRLVLFCCYQNYRYSHVRLIKREPPVLYTAVQMNNPSPLVTIIE